MKKFYIYLGAFLMLLANSAWATELNVKVSNIDVKRNGNIIVMVFAEEGFPKNHKAALLVKTKRSLHETMEFSFKLDLQELAIKVLHDENGDGKVSKNWTGLYPKEGLGFSNDQKIGITGPPNYKNSKLPKGVFKKGVTISLTYP